ncbi:MAG: GntR family transcriptional regulator [Lachnospiraceae bacterium]|nr:GntR family transcriptional regulator [Lachnospiraceae bacterium]
MEIVKQSVRNQLLELIKTAILDGTYPMGSKLNLDELRRRLGVSNTPLREAISILEGQGLVQSRANQGVFVVSPTRQEHFELAQYMLFLMLSAYDYCVENKETTPLLSLMQKELDLQKLYVEREDTYHYALCSNNFDRCIIDYTENACLIRNYDSHFALLTLMNAEYAANDRQSMQAFYLQHKNILAAMRRGDRELVRRLLKEHYYKAEWIPEGFTWN